MTLLLHLLAFSLYGSVTAGDQKLATEEHAVLWFLRTLRKRKEAYPESSAERRSDSIV